MDAAPALNAPKPQPPKKGNALAITGLVLSAMFFLPLIPTIGLILGIVALCTGRSKPISIVAICLGAFFTFFMGIYAAIAIPAFMKYVRRARTSEAHMFMSQLSRAVGSLSAQEWAALPDSEWTPAGDPCAHPKGKLAVDAIAWKAEPWKTINFAVGQPTHYQLRVTRNAQGFLVEARGDLDCDGKRSHFQQQVTSEGPQPLEITDELE